MPALWPHQTRGVNETLAAIARGEKRICLTSPTGGGKSLMACTLIDHWLDAGLRVALYTNRKMLVDQLSGVLQRHGINHGIRAAGYETDLGADVQVSSIQTEHSRVTKRETWGLHGADRVLLDEAHLQKSDMAKKLLEAHLKAGASYVGLTATPLGIGALYDALIVAGTNSELRACGALVPCSHFGCDEPDLSKIGKVALGEDLTEKQNVKAMMTQGVFGRVLDHWRQLNPEGKPTILFAPGVKESVWFAEQFQTAGVSAAHIDGQEVWVNGNLYRSSREARADVLEGSRDGSIRVLCNRFVLREGIDAPWLGHGIFATVFGSLQSYLQSGGRLLRAHPSLDCVVLQDHGGNWWRHGSLNADREWRLDYTNAIVAGMREESLRRKKCKRCGCDLKPGSDFCPKCSFANPPQEPIRCPECSRILTSMTCPCGWEAKGGKRSRPVVQSDGTLKEMVGDIYKPRRVSTLPDAERIWRSVYHRAKKAGMTFRQAEALYAKENRWGWPSKDLPLMPKESIDSFRRVADVPADRLK